jgi:hypothetical protein
MDSYYTRYGFILSVIMDKQTSSNSDMARKALVGLSMLEETTT